MSSQSESAGSERLVYERALPAVPLAVGWIRRELDGVLERLGVEPTRRHDVSLVLSEAASNVVVHAYESGAAGLLYTLAAVAGGDLRLDVLDSGRGMAPRPTSPGLGVGLALMARLSDGLEIATNESGGVQVSALFRGIEIDATAPQRSRAEQLADYAEALRGALEETRADMRALHAQAEQAIRRALQLRDERRREPLV